MSPKARRRAAAASLVALIAGGALAFGQFSGTFAIFTAETENPSSTFKGSWIPAPSGTSSALPTATPWSQLSLSWTSGNSTAMPGGATNPVTAQAILYADGGSGASASCGSYSAFSTPTAAATSASVAGTNVPDWWCFEVQSTSTSATTSGAWTSDVVTFTPRRILVPISVVYANASGTANKLDTNDTITITFNQTVTTAAGTKVCEFNTGTILIGDATCSNVGTDPWTVGKITGLTIGGGAHSGVNATTTIAGAVVTVKITQNGQNTTSGGTFTASNSVLAGTLGACSSAASPTCTVTPTGSF